MDSKFDPGSKDYWISILWISLIGLIITVIALLLSLMWTPLRQCNILGGYEPRENFCLTCRSSDRRKPYNRMEVLSLKIVFFILLAIATAACVIGGIGNQRFNTHFKKSTSSLKTTMIQTVNQTAQVYITLSDAGLVDLGDVDIQTQLTTLNSSQETISTLIKQVKQANAIRFYFLYIVIVFVLLAHLLAIVSGLFHVKTFSEYASKAAWYSLVAVWFLFTAHFALTIVMGDMCNDLDKYVEYKTDGSSSTTNSSYYSYFNDASDSNVLTSARGILDLVINCSQPNGTFLGEGVEITDEQMQTLVDQLNDFLYNNDPNMDRTAYTYTLANMHESMNLSWVQNDTEIYNAVVDILEAIDKVDIARIRLQELNKCDFLGAGYQSVRDESCVGVLVSANLLWIAFLVMSAVMTFTAFLTSMAYKRFRKKAFVTVKPHENAESSAIHMQI